MHMQTTFSHVPKSIFVSLQGMSQHVFRLLQFIHCLFKENYEKKALTEGFETCMPTLCTSRCMMVLFFYNRSRVSKDSILCDGIPFKFHDFQSVLINMFDQHNPRHFFVLRLKDDIV